jgi:hypothetical protein
MPARKASLRVMAERGRKGLQPIGAPAHQRSALRGDVGRVIPQCKGVPMRLELCPRDLESRSVICKMRVAPVHANGGAVKETLTWDDLGTLSHTEMRARLRVNNQKPAARVRCSWRSP